MTLRSSWSGGFLDSLPVLKDLKAGESPMSLGKVIAHPVKNLSFISHFNFSSCWILCRCCRIPGPAVWGTGPLQRDADPSPPSRFPSAATHLHCPVCSAVLQPPNRSQTLCKTRSQLAPLHPLLGACADRGGVSARSSTCHLLLLPAQLHPSRPVQPLRSAAPLGALGEHPHPGMHR